MVDVNDDSVWFDAAFRYPELAAVQIARFKNPWWNPPCHDLIPVDSPPFAAPVPAPPESAGAKARACRIPWGFRKKRSRRTAFARIRCAKKEAAASAGSPDTPLDFGSGYGASSSCGEEGSSSPEAVAAAAKRLRSGESTDVSGGDGGGRPGTKVAGGSDRLPLASGISASRDIRRPSKKRGLSELREESRLLLEEKELLRKELVSGRKACEYLKAENKRLKSRKSKLQNTPNIAVVAAASSTALSSRSQFLLPDLNEPLSETLD